MAEQGYNREGEIRVFIFQYWVTICTKPLSSIEVFFPSNMLGRSWLVLSTLSIFTATISATVNLGCFFLLLSLCLVHHGCIVFCLVFYYFLSFSWLVFIFLWLWTFFIAFFQIGFLCSVYLAFPVRFYSVYSFVRGDFDGSVVWDVSGVWGISCVLAPFLDVFVWCAHYQWPHVLFPR